MLRIPTAVLMMIGQIAVMKMTKDSRRMAIAECCERQRQPGEWRNRAQYLEQRIERTHGPDAGTDQHADRHADQRRERVTDCHTLETGEQMPEQSFVDAVVVERINDQRLRLLHHAYGRRQAGPWRRRRRLPDADNERKHEQRRNDYASERSKQREQARHPDSCRASRCRCCVRTFQFSCHELRAPNGETGEVRAGVRGIETLAVEEALDAARFRLRNLRGCGTPSACAASRHKSSRLTCAISLVWS